MWGLPIAMMPLIGFLVAGMASSAPVPITIASSSLPAAVKAELVKTVSEALEDDSDLTPIQRKDAALKSTITFVNARLSGPPAILLTPVDKAADWLCAPNGNDNCTTWLFATSSDHASLLYLDDGGQGIVIQKTSHHGMHDLLTSSRLGHTPLDIFYTEQHFDGNQYQSAVCWDWKEDDGGTVTETAHKPCS